MLVDRLVRISQIAFWIAIEGFESRNIAKLSRNEAASRSTESQMSGSAKFNQVVAFLIYIAFIFIDLFELCPVPALIRLSHSVVALLLEAGLEGRNSERCDLLLM